jgi:hypothetical protein
MALSLTASIVLSSSKTADSGDRTASDARTVSSRTEYTDGTGASSANKVYDPGLQTLSGSNHTYDLSGSLTNAIGEAVVFSKVRVLYAKAPSTNTGTVTLFTGAAAWNTLIAGTLTLRPNTELMVKCLEGTAYGVTATSADILTIAGGSGNAYQLYLSGE